MRKNIFEPVPIVEGPWQSGSIKSSIGTFEAADDDPLKFANPLSVGLTLLRTEPEGVRETRLTMVRKANQ